MKNQRHSPLDGTSSAIRALGLGLMVFLSALNAPAQTVIAWGDNSQGQATVPNAASNVVAVAAGSFHSLALRSDGTVITWGASAAPVPDNATNVTAIAAGASHDLALRSDGTIIAWGANTYGQAAVPDSATNVIAVAAMNNHSMALRADGNVVTWGSVGGFINGSTNVVSSSNLLAIADGALHGLAVGDDGTVATWGTRFLNWPAVPFPVLRSVGDAVAVACNGLNQDLVLRANGQVRAWGPHHPAVPAYVTNVIAIAALTNYFLALSADGRVMSWGVGAVTNAPLSVTNATAIAAGMLHGLAIVNGTTPRIMGHIAYSRRAVAGTPLPLCVRATGGLPLSYQWLADGVPIDGATNAVPQIPAVLGNDLVAYQVVVSSAWGQTTSAVASVAVSTTGGWGDNANGQCNVPFAVTNATAVAAGSFHALALNPDGSVVAWGKNTDGQAGVPAAATNLVAVAAGSDHSLALKNDGSVMAWGRNWDGQTSVPPEATNIVAVAAGWAHSLALRSDGSVLAWGNDDYGQTDVSLLATGVVAIAAGYYHSLALRADHTVVAWGLINDAPQLVGNVVAIAGGCGHSLALRGDGSVLAWGDNSYGQCTVPADATNLVAVTAGYHRSLGVRSDGTIVTWGQGYTGVTNLPNSLRNVATIAAGEDFSLAVVDPGPPHFGAQMTSLFAHLGGQASLNLLVSGAHPLALQWFHDGILIPGATNRYLLRANLAPGDGGNYVLVASNAVGQASSQPIHLTVQSEPAIVTGFPNQTLPSGKAFCLTASVAGAQPLNYQWQFNGANLSNGGRISGVTTPVLCFATASSADSGNYSLVAMNSYGSVTGLVAQILVSQVQGWGDNSLDQLDQPAGLTNIVAIAGGGAHSLAIRADRSLAAWGDDTSGQIDVPPWATNINAIAGGWYHSVAVRSNGTVIAWGDNSFGQTNVPSSTAGAVAVAAGAFHSLALRTNGAVVAWGSNEAGLTNVPASAANVVAIAAGRLSSLALRADGTLVRWGTPTTIPAVAASNVVAIAAGDDHLLALQASGNLVAWGDNTYGQTAVPASVTNVVAIAASGNHSLALLAGGTVVGWGSDDFGQSTLAAGAANAAAIAAGGSHSLALVPDAGSSAPPAITQQPQGGTFAVSTTALLYSSALGSPPLQYQWYFQGAPLAGQNNPWLVLPYILPSQAGAYRIVVTNGFGSATSAVATISVSGAPSPPNILIQPVSQSVSPGTNVAFTVSVSGSPPLMYRWQKDGAALTNGGRLAGADAATLWITNVQSGDAGNYWVTITNYAGARTSAVATLTVAVSAPTITGQPTSRTIGAGSNAIFTVTASGTPPLAYQWRFNQGNLAAATTNSVTLTNVQAANAGAYDVVVTNPYGMVTSVLATLTVTPTAPWIVTQPQSRSAARGQDIAFALTAQGTEPLTCQWQRSGTNLTGATGFVLSLSAVQPGDIGTYRAVVSNAVGSATSAEAVLTLVPVLAWGQTNFGAATIPIAASNAVAIAAGSSELNSPCLAMRADGSLINWGYGSGQSPIPADATNVVAIAVGGGFFTNSYFALRTDGTVLSWGDSSDQQTNVPPGATNVVAIAAGGFHALALRDDGTIVGWGRNAEGQTSIPVSATNIVAIAAGNYHSLALRADGSVVAWGDDRFGQTDAPSSATNVTAIAAGGTNSLALRADGMVIAWGDNTFGQTNVPVAATNIVGIAAGYRHELALREDGAVIGWGYNGYGETAAPVYATNAVAIAAGGYHSLALVQDPPAAMAPLIGRAPSSAAVIGGQMLLLHSVTVASLPCRLQWFFNGTLLAGQTNQWLAVANVQLDQAGAYQLVASNNFGAVTSAVATVSVSVSSPVLSNPTFTSNGWALKFYGLKGLEYTVEYKTQLDDNAWVELQRIQGIGGMLLITDQSPTATRRFYRVRAR
jgi:alpha-tubulin suppressor-like RCC1 family protein